MAGKPKRMSQVKQILQLHNQGYGNKTIARDLGVSKNTVKSYLEKYRRSKISLSTLLKMEEHALEKVFHPGNPAYKDNRFEVLKSRLDGYVEELNKTGVTKQLLWEEYRMSQPEGYSLSQFTFHLSQHIKVKRPSMVLHHEPGEKLFVDFAGKPLSFIDPNTGEVINCQVFVACLPYSDYGFCLAVPSQRIDDFIHALTCCLESLGGVPKVLVPDNLKSAVIKANKYEPTLNRVLEDFANHNNMAVVPARARKPKDKALVENQVKLIYNRVYARIRHQQFFSLHQLNDAIKHHMLKHNQTRMQKHDYCREEHFLSNEKPLLKELPAKPFEIKYYKTYKLAPNNHIYLGEDKHYYSAPYQYIGQKLKVVYTRSLVRIFHQHILIAVHKRKSGIGRYTTNKEHLCSTHQYYLNRSPEYYKKKAGKLSETLKELVELIFSQNRYPEQLYKSCDGLFSLHKNTSLKTFEKACQMAIDHQNYSYLFVQNVIRNKTTEYVEEQPRKNLPDHHNIRGKEYYNNQLPLKLKNNGEY
ncbi:IS21 family transposase [Cyclobacterium amurskyense]|jgi:transposase|uniref:IS21 family transposase n=1 Tax=Cyclobacterium amurskyense TaxID=320787 RepID=UPI0030DC6AA1|tara:strand:- start:439 stop:2022 length:1584 start_codon:yes stop_codon:yes gene_type:complete